MKARVLFFGHLGDIAGSGEHILTLPESARVEQLHDVLFEKWPALRPHGPTLLTAVNLSYARRDDIIPPDAEVAIMPPVQGG
jgi:molybdopterin synthase sulfur carrier subunit